MKPTFENALRLFSLAVLGLMLAVSTARAVQVPETQLLPDPEKTLGEPVVYIQLAPEKKLETAYVELKKRKQYILGYKEIFLLDLNTDHPVLVTWTYNQKQRQLTKTYMNWNEIDSIQIPNPKIKVPEKESGHENDIS